MKELRTLAGWPRATPFKGTLPAISSPQRGGYGRAAPDSHGKGPPPVTLRPDSMILTLVTWRRPDPRPITLAMIPVQLEEGNTNVLIAKLSYIHESR